MVSEIGGYSGLLIGFSVLDLGFVIAYGLDLVKRVLNNKFSGQRWIYQFTVSTVLVNKVRPQPGDGFLTPKAPDGAKKTYKFK